MEYANFQGKHFLAKSLENVYYLSERKGAATVKRLTEIKNAEPTAERSIELNIQTTESLNGAVQLFSYIFLIFTVRAIYFEKFNLFC
jgi:hypothetical protein